MTHKVKFGLYDPGCPPHLAPLAEAETRLGAPVRVVSWYQAWGSGYARCCPELITQAHARGLIPVITWEPWRLPTDLPEGAAPQLQPEFSLARIAAGAFEGYVRDWARALAALPGPVFLRPLHEMNGNWYPWGGTVNGNDAKDFRRAWRYLHRVFQEEGAVQVEWVWCPYVISVPETPVNALEAYFPGEESVDWVALDGYNWGSSQSWSCWQSFTDVFGEAYRRLQALAPNKPVMLAEVGCAEAGGDKAKWLKEGLGSLADDFPRVEVLVWFDIDKECDWRLDSSPASLAAFREAAHLFGK